MRLRVFRLPVAALCGAVAILVSGCANQAAPSAILSPPPSVAPSATVDPVARDAFNEAICPIFSTILEIDPRLAAMREAGLSGGDVSEQVAEIQALTEELLAVLDDLEAVPEWTQGARLRYDLIAALHTIRAELLHVARDPAAHDAADNLASLPFIASEQMDLAMRDAVRGGLACEDAG